MASRPRRRSRAQHRRRVRERRAIGTHIRRIGESSRYFRTARPANPGAGRAVVAAHKERARLLDAVVIVAAERGYAHLTVAEIAGRAGVSRRTFHAHFEDAEACFLFAYRAGAQVLINDWDRPRGGWHELLAAGIDELTRTFADNPALARTVFFESGEAGPKALALRIQVREMFVQRLRALSKQARAEDLSIAPASDVEIRAVVGGIRWLIESHLLDHDATTLPELNDALEALAASAILR